MSGKSRLNLRYLDNNILLTNTHAWTWVNVPLQSYEFLEHQERVSLAWRMTSALSALISSSQESVEAQLLLIRKPFNVTGWEYQLDDRVRQWGPAPGWGKYRTEMATYLGEVDFERKSVYLGVCLGPRRGKGSVSKSKDGGLLEMVSNVIPILSVGTEEEVTPAEIEGWTARAMDVRRTLGRSSLRARPASHAEVAYLIAHPFWPSMRQPPPTSSDKDSWGAGELRLLGGGVVSNRRKWVEIEQVNSIGESQVGYAATLCVSRFPDIFRYPEMEPWMHFISTRGVPVDFNIRMHITPPQKVRKDVSKKLADARDQISNIEGSGASMPLDIREQLEVATSLEYQIDKDRVPWFYGRHRLRVTGETVEELTARAKSVIEAYRDLSMEVVWPSGDQFDLMMEGLPGGRVISTSYHQRQELAIVGAGMSPATSEVGDIDEGGTWMGPYIGYTTSRTLNPVFFSPHVAMSRNISPGVAITGAPGGGKALALDTPIPTPDGWTTMGDIRVGDPLFDEAGNVCRVTHATDVMSNRPCFRVTLEDGESIVADAEHQWWVNIGDSVGNSCVLTTQELAESSSMETFSIPQAEPLNIATRTLTRAMDSYVYDFLTLGFREDVGAEILRAGTHERYRFLLRLAERAVDPHPHVNLPSDPSKVTIVLAYPAQRRALGELLATLGVTAEVEQDLGSWKVTFPREMLNGNWLSERPSVLRRVKSIEPVESVPVRCIQVDSPKRLFLAGRTMVPTHNSFLAFTLAYQMAVQGVWTIYIDPKADAKPMGELQGLPNPRVFDLRDGNDGMLDPFSLGENRSESSLLALETLRLLLGGQVSEEREEALLNAVEVVGQSGNPSLSLVVDTLLANTESTGARNLGTVLKTIRELPFARLCFSTTGGDRIRPEDGLTVVTLLGLELPTASTKQEDYSYENRLAVSVMYLLTRYARRLMLSMNKSHPKAICIDEAWAITTTPQGAKLIPEIARMGRSHNTALVLVSQNAGDLMSENVTNSISTKFAYRSTDSKEIANVLDLFGVEQNSVYAQTIRELRNGECLMRDIDGRISTVQIDSWEKTLWETFNTNPETRGKGSTGSQE